MHQSSSDVSSCARIQAFLRDEGLTIRICASCGEVSLVLARFPCVHRGFVFEVAPASWAKPRSFNGHGFHRIPPRTPSKQDQQLPLLHFTAITCATPHLTRVHG